jgi:hypothetical protein
MAVARDNTVHFAWVEGSGDHGGTVYYRTARAGQLGVREMVHAPQGWNECDVAVDAAGSPVIAANTTLIEEMAVYERTDSGWTPTVLPSDNTLNKWAPSLTFAESGLLCVAFRRKDKHPFTWQVRQDGRWSKDTRMPARSYEPNLIASETGFIASSLDGFVYFLDLRDGEFVESHRNVRTMKRGITRGQHVGLGMTTHGTLVLSHSDMTNANVRHRTIGPEHRFYYSFSRDRGQTWTFNRPVAVEPGQGHGDLGVNREWIMLVWPDLRGGIRYTLLRDSGAAQDSIDHAGNGIPPK